MHSRTALGDWREGRGVTSPVPDFYHAPGRSGGCNSSAINGKPEGAAGTINSLDDCPALAILTCRNDSRHRNSTAQHSDWTLMLPCSKPSPVETRGRRHEDRGPEICVHRGWRLSAFTLCRMDGKLTEGHGCPLVDCHDVPSSSHPDLAPVY